MDAERALRGGNRSQRELVRDLVATGRWVLMEPTRSGHLRLRYVPTGDVIVGSGRRSSDWRADRNFRSRARRIEEGRPS